MNKVLLVKQLFCARVKFDIRILCNTLAISTRSVPKMCLCKESTMILYRIIVYTLKQLWIQEHHNMWGFIGDLVKVPESEIPNTDFVLSKTGRAGAVRDG